MKVSTLICVHSTNEHYDLLLARALHSIYMQSRLPEEVIVVLDECWEGTDILMTHQKDNNVGLPIKVLSKPKKEGLAVAKNFGLQHCTGDWITFLDADDEWEPTKLEKQVEFLRENPEYDFVGTLATDVYNDGRTSPSCFQPGQYQTHDQILNRICHENVMCHGSMMIRKSALDTLGGYDTSKEWLGREDHFLWYMALLRGYKFYNLPLRLYRYSMETSVER